MINSRQGKALKSFGGVIFTIADNDGVKTLADVKGKKFMAVGRWLIKNFQMPV
jgi:twitching motility protein PilJ